MYAREIHGVQPKVQIRLGSLLLGEREPLQELDYPPRREPLAHLVEVAEVGGRLGFVPRPVADPVTVEGEALRGRGVVVAAAEVEVEKPPKQPHTTTQKKNTHF